MADQPLQVEFRSFFDDALSREKDAPPELRAPLALFHGEPPPAPAWFKAAIAQAPDRGFVATPRGRIETLTWGEVGRPGLLFVPGNTAHADWWSFICPFFAETYRVTAMSLAGMGESEWRDAYSFDAFADDAEDVARATGLHEGGRKPIYVAHSFGGGEAFWVASRRPEQLHAAIIVDVGFVLPTDHVPTAAMRQGPSRVYPSLAAALARFRLAPVQPVANLYILDHIARRSLRPAALPDGSGQGWTWKFDPDMWAKFDQPMMQAFFASSPSIHVPVAHIFGEQSSLRSTPGLSDFYPQLGFDVGMPDAHHHIMVDQPLALTAAIRSLLAAWRA